MKKFFPVLLLLFAFTSVLRAQDSYDDILNFKLPPLDSLFKGALKGPMAELYDIQKGGEMLLLKSEKRKWLEYFSLSGTYQFGVMGVSSFLDLGENYPLVYQYTGGEQIFYNAGASVRFPLDKIFDRRSRIKRQRLKIRELELQKDVWYDDNRAKIIELYFKSQEILSNIRLLVDQAIFADELYNSTKKKYLIGAALLQDLNTAMVTQAQTKMQLERSLAELKSSVMKLEILTNTKILN
ncbi:MAG: TolC family protein [Bacteroidales bacterium]|nr:TolC family protein [Bacteroidales bacterium]MDD3989178.1 TolC family protein [Bacteroidales bacterium]